MSTCIGSICGMCAARNPQYEHPAIHCPGCAENANLEQNQDEQIYELRHDRDLWHREHGKLHDENAQLRVQLAQRTAALHIAGRHFIACGESADSFRESDPVGWDTFKKALADLPDAPKEEEP
jgi:hypothetical protein